MQNKFSPSTLKQLCSQYNFSPSKRFGQNYLISDALIRKIIEAADLKNTDVVVEIGPGFGILTLALAPLVKKVIAFEIEKKLQPYWGELQKEFKNIEIIWGNAIKQITSYELRITDYKVIANLPYQITSHILRLLLEMENKPEKIVVMVQKEVADRICAKPGDMSLLSVSVQYYGEPKIVAKVSRGNFWPEPKVDSAILSIQIPTLGSGSRLYPDVPMEKPSRILGKVGIKSGQAVGTFSDEEFFKVVKVGFGNKRKQLWRNLSVGLKIDAEKVKKAVKEATGNEKVRAEELSVEQWKGVIMKLETWNMKHGTWNMKHET